MEFFMFLIPVLTCFELGCHFQLVTDKQIYYLHYVRNVPINLVAYINKVKLRISHDRSFSAKFISES
jgi:hypothetical protein